MSTAATSFREISEDYPSIERINSVPENVVNIALHIEYLGALYVALLGATAVLLEHSHAVGNAQSPDFTVSIAITAVGAVGLALNEVGHRIKETLVRAQWL